MYLLMFQICWGIPVGNHNSASNNKLLQKTSSQKLVNKIGKNRLWHAPMGKGTLGGILHGGGKLAHLGMMKDLPTVDILNIKSYLQWAAPQQRSRLWLPFFISLITTVNRISCTSSLLQLNANVYIRVNHTTFTDLYYHTFQYWNHTIISNTSTNFLRMWILPSETILYSDF